MVRRRRRASWPSKPDGIAEFAIPRARRLFCHPSFRSEHWHSIPFSETIFCSDCRLRATIAVGHSWHGPSGQAVLQGGNGFFDPGPRTPIVLANDDGSFYSHREGLDYGETHCLEGHGHNHLNFTKLGLYVLLEGGLGIRSPHKHHARLLYRALAYLNNTILVWCAALG